MVEKAVRRSGVVLLDLCGGGALGVTTLAMTGAGEALGRFFLQLSLPHPCAFSHCRSPSNRSGIKGCYHACCTFSFTTPGS
ncbi:hypothetical protein [Methanosarcina sp.]|uniref:hypothetical protein n=1 Tax=Methanosarcina sp. TaxID=2213 RepID=UPI0029883D68|nr:hypothetical protein [Methanosarcina sp.]MDW5551425.1 hypothetical protein [Methanosarcina sp.]MDW5554460.1 hypothetical protein [Methanosarcina sp.]MDW5559073.1 hypothetical protein [Methanosarcina sp.]